MSINYSIDLHKNATAIQVGEVLQLNRQFTKVVLQISGTSSARTLAFEASVNGQDFVRVMGQNMTDLSIATTATGNEIWKIDVDGYEAFRAPLIAVTGGVSVGAAASGV